MAPTESQTRSIPIDELGDRLSRLRLSQPTADEKMLRSLERYGQLSAMAAFDDGERLQLVDGFKVSLPQGCAVMF
jgi:hypothetical protein